MLAHDKDLAGMDEGQLGRKIIWTRIPIWTHAIQEGDDRCHLDDSFIYAALPEKIGVVTALAPKEEFMKDCQRFCRDFQNCPALKVWIRGRGRLNLNVSAEELREELLMLRHGLRRHWGRPKHENRLPYDVEVYSLLPGEFWVDFTLPPEPVFLPNCGRFYDTRDPFNLKLHEW